MSLEKITKSILDDAERESARILHAAQITAQRNVDSARKELRNNLADRLKAAEAEFEEKKAIEISNVDAGYRQQLLEIKNVVIGDVFKRSTQQVTSLSNEEYLSLIEKWLQTINTAGQISIGPKDSKRITQGFISKVNQSRTKSSSLSLSKDFVDISGGFIVKTEKFEMDYSIDTITSNLREQLGPKIAKKLFGELRW
jgi:vacuolar-type H+-ATPase subunit E/Vma4